MSLFDCIYAAARAGIESKSLEDFPIVMTMVMAVENGTNLLKSE